MPLMRAKFERCGEPIPMRVEKRDYLFQENHKGDFVAFVDSVPHTQYLLDTGNFEIVEANSNKSTGTYSDPKDTPIGSEAVITDGPIEDTATCEVVHSSKKTGRKHTFVPGDSSDLMDI